MESEDAFDSLSCQLLLDDPTPMPESVLLTTTVQIMAEGGAKHFSFSCNTASSNIDCAASKKVKSGAARKREEKSGAARKRGAALLL